MTCRFLILICIFQVIISVMSNDYRNNYMRIKQAKYYSNPPPRFYKLPPPDQLIRTPFSYTPPPDYMDGEHPARKPAKVNKHKEGLGDEDFKMLIKHLSKQDFDRILEFAAVRNGYAEQSRPFEKRPYYNNERVIQATKAINFPDSGQTIVLDDTSSNFVQVKSTDNLDPYDKPDVSPYLNPEETNQNEQITYLNGFIEQELYSGKVNNQPNQDSNTFYTSSDTMKEEQLPKPENLRDNGDFEISYTNNVPTVVKSNSYKLENFASLPLMNYENSKLEYVNSYNVPHYTVTSARNQQPQPPPTSSLSSSISSSASLPVQPAPPKSFAAEQSDAHLKATKIWTHKSTGTAYTLHDDGTLSLERPVRPKRKF